MIKLNHSFKSFRLMPLWLISCITTIVGLSNPAHAYKPEDPEIQEMVSRGIQYLGSLDEAGLMAARYGGSNGALLLAAYTHLKVEHDEDAPIVKLGLKHAMEFVNSIKGGELHGGHKLNYEASVAILFLAELDAQRYFKELEKLGLALLDLQMSHGGYGYHGEPLGDVSQVQYVVLALWTLDRAGVEIPLKRADKVLGWISRVQDVGGGWPYKGTDPGTGALMSQMSGGISHSTSLAGGSAALIAADVFRLWGQNDAGDPGIEGLPKAIRKAENENNVESRRKQTRVSREQVLNAAGRLNAYRQNFAIKRDGGMDWFYYLIYSLERYESFLELATGKADNQWYDNGVEELMKLQDASGAWSVKDPSHCDPPTATSFAILFLIRSTKKAIGTTSTGSLAGGYGLPSDTTKIVVNGTQIKGEPTAAAVTDLLELLEADDADSVNNSSIPENLQLESDPERRKLQLARLERVVRGSESWQARRVAARLLGSSDDLKVVPGLVFALSDPDKPTRTYALNGLQFISRRFGDFALSDNPDSAEVRKIQQEWLAWYKKIYPNYISYDGY